jgi:cytoskeletal protein CcmA (bactofilin family)
MLKTSFCYIFLALALFLFAWPVSDISAATYLKAKQYYLPVEDTLSDDVFLFASEATFDGTIAKDLLLFSRRYVLSGNVLGNINSFSQYATIRGIVDNSVRIGAQRAYLDGQINGNLLVFASEVELSRSSVVNRDATIFGNDVSIMGNINGKLTAAGQSLYLAGKVIGDVTLEGDKITIAAPAEIDGNLTYECPQEIKLDEGVTVKGKVDWKKVESAKEEKGQINWTMRLIFFVCALVTGLILIAVFNRHSKIATEQILQKPLISLGIGFIALCITPVAVLILALTLAGIPASIILLLAFAIAFYVAKIYAALAIGRMGLTLINKKSVPKQGWSLLLGLIILSLLFVIPVVGGIIYFLVVFLGLGAMLLSIRACRQMESPLPPSTTA